MQVLLLSNIRRSDLTDRLKIIYQDKFALLETRGTQKSNDNDAVSATSMAYLVTVSYEATDRAPSGGHRHNRGPRGCIASRLPSSGEMASHSDALQANGRGMKGRRFRRWRWPWNEGARAAGRRGARRRGRLHRFRQECPEGDHNIDVEGNSTCQSGRFVRNTRVSPCGS